MNLTEVDQEESCVHHFNPSCSGASTLTDMLLYLFVAVIFFLTICGNLLVIVSISHFKQLHTPTNILLLSLAAADFLIGVIVMPFNFIMYLRPSKKFHPVHCVVCNLASLCLTFVSIYNVVFIAVDRYFALCNPFFYSSKMTVKLTLWIISILWLYSLIYNGVLIYSNGGLSAMKGNITYEVCMFAINKVWATVDFLFACILPCTTIIILYLKIFSIARMHANAIKCFQKHSNATKINNNYSNVSERKAAKILGILVSVFLLCVIPYFICYFVNVYVSNPDVFLALMGTTVIFSLNSSINPIIYALFYSWFQKFVKIIVTLGIYGSGSSTLNVLVK